MPLSKETRHEFERLARLMYFSKETVAHETESMTAGQADRICETIAFEQDVRARRKKEKLFGRAAFPQLKSFEGYDFSQVSFPDEYGEEDLKALEFMKYARDFVFYGQTGRGKTHLSIAIGAAAVENGMNVRFFATAQLVMGLLKASDAGTLDALTNDLRKCGLLILDEFGYVPMDVNAARLLFQVVSDCYERRSLILTTDIEFSKWGTVLGDDKLAAAMIDRIIHHGRLLEFGGESKRMCTSLMLGKGKE